MAATLLDVEAVRSRFSALRDGGFVFLDAPGGSQVPDEVGDAIASALREASANIGATYETSKRVEQILATARDDAARFFACSPDDVIFGTNMTWLDFALSRTAAHVPTDVQALGCDVFIASAYKFCGPHLGVAYGRHDLLESWRPYKARPAASEPVGRRFEVGTAPYELLAGFSATLAYLASIGGMEAIAAYERELGQRFLDGLPDGATVYGLQTMDGRVPTFLINLEGVDAVEAVKRLSDEGFGVWAHDNWYSLGLREKLPYPDSAIRVGLIHYNTADEIDRFNAALAAL